MIKDKHRKHLSKKYVRKLFVYDRETGILTYRIARGRIKAGSLAGVVGKRGRRVLTINAIKYYASRVIWLYVTGRWPKHELDHVNQDRADDRWNNLREATRIQNGSNRAWMNNRHGYKGVKLQSYVPGRKVFRYYASIKVAGKDVYLGRFNSVKDAAVAYDCAALKYHGSFASLNFGD